MHVVLTAAYDPGDADAGETYAHVRLHTMDWSKADSSVTVQCIWGNWDDPDWTNGIKISPQMVLHSARYDDILADLSLASEPCSDAWDRAILDELVAGGDLVGTVTTGA